MQYKPKLQRCGIKNREGSENLLQVFDKSDKTITGEENRGIEKNSEKYIARLK